MKGKTGIVLGLALAGFLAVGAVNTSYAWDGHGHHHQYYLQGGHHYDHHYGHHYGYGHGYDKRHHVPYGHYKRQYYGHHYGHAYGLNYLLKHLLYPHHD